MCLTGKLPVSANVHILKLSSVKKNMNTIFFIHRCIAYGSIIVMTLIVFFAISFSLDVDVDSFLFQLFLIYTYILYAVFIFYEYTMCLLDICRAF